MGRGAALPSLAVLVSVTPGATAQVDSGGASGACDLALEARQLAPVIDYDAFDLALATATVDWSVENRADAPCQVLVGVRDLADQPPPFVVGASGAPVTVTLADAQPAASQSTEAGSYLVTVGPNASRALQLDLAVPQGRVIEAGSYDQPFRIVFETTGGEQLAGPVEGTIRLAVPPRAQVNVAGADGRFGEAGFLDEVVFDDPRRGDRRRVFVQVRSNANATVTLSSRNGGVMVNEEAEGSAIAWSAEVSGVPLDLSAPSVVATTGPTQRRGASLPLDIVVGEATRRFAGTYTDLVTVTVTTE